MGRQQFARMPAEQAVSIDPLDIEIEPGFCVRNLESVEACAGILVKIDVEVGNIINQIGHSEEFPEHFKPGWRSRAQNALRWKKRLRQAIVQHQMSFPKGAMDPGKFERVDNRCKLILNVIEEDIGEEAMQRYVRITRHRNPDAFAPVDNGDNGDNP